MDASFVDTAACGDLDGIKEMLKNADLPANTINYVDKDGRSAFHYGCLNDDAPLLTILLADARVNVMKESPNGDTGLHMAVLYAALQAMQMLFDDGRISLNAQNKFGETPLHLCAGSGDAGAAKAAKLLLDAGASLLITDKWNRGPLNVAKDNAENPLVLVLSEFLDTNPAQKAKVDEITAAYKAEEVSYQAEQNQAKLKAKNAIFGALGGGIGGIGGVGGGLGGLLGGVKLKKTVVVEKTMFSKQAGDSSFTASVASAVESSDKRRALSKLIDFPGDAEEIKKHLDNPDINVTGADAYGLTAMHKFASWNKTIYLEMIIPKLTKEELNATCPEGKTPLHWAVEMAAVGSVQLLVGAGIDIEAKDKKGHTVNDILDAAAPSTIIDRLKKALSPP